MTYVIVGFKVTDTKSIHYAQVKTLVAVFRHIEISFEKGADFISLRVIK